jgi:DNA-binding response OmpR family regulator
MKPRILIVEDEPGIADTVRYALATEGFEPHWFATGAEALAQARALQPALVLLDIGLPDASGLELLRQVWDDPAESFDRTVDAHVKTLRAKLKQVAPQLEPIRTHRGSGYALAEDLPATL